MNVIKVYNGDVMTYDESYLSDGLSLMAATLSSVQFWGPRQLISIVIIYEDILVV